MVSATLVPLKDDQIDALPPDAWRDVMNHGLIRRARIGYYGSIPFIDHQLGGCSAGLEQYFDLSTDLSESANLVDDLFPFFDGRSRLFSIFIHY
ncbi:hypothetical protein [Paenibacillus pabuli]|uniref:hypothetical protein n=1 Tax=Paenibacillus pabuli TaxID=1472 RepID=UPI003CF8AA6F